MCFTCMILYDTRKSITGVVAFLMNLMLVDVVYMYMIFQYLNTLEPTRVEGTQYREIYIHIQRNMYVSSLTSIEVLHPLLR